MAVEKITAAERKKLAQFRAARILESVIDTDWWPEELEHRYGRETVMAVRKDMLAIADDLLKRSGRGALTKRMDQT